MSIKGFKCHKNNAFGVVVYSAKAGKGNAISTDNNAIVWKQEDIVSYFFYR